MSLSIRLQFPDGRSEVVAVDGTTTVAALYDEHVAAHISPGQTGQLLYMGRVLAPPTSRLADHGIHADTVVQVFLRRPQPTPDSDPGAVDPNYVPPGLGHGLMVMGGFALLAGWMYLFFAGEENEDDEWELNVPACLCLAILSVTFLLIGKAARIF
ncbi:uncharacterized protein LOC129600754 [Paramacrobiotus metropolitanus]|uniref:uncharacterized protein LOC129600754 n=1 Tax=Paramacrobiotus metropolitanus TaxID=2943436 RepID=UPI002445DA58|nr:uncharacterized protein LOC129600754 [Paramacrobiotus metropolitanus]